MGALTLPLRHIITIYRICFRQMPSQHDAVPPLVSIFGWAGVLEIDHVPIDVIIPKLEYALV
jgi:hypothetical protein